MEKRSFEVTKLKRNNFVKNEIDPYGEIRGIESEVKTEKNQIRKFKKYHLPKFYGVAL